MSMTLEEMMKYGEKIEKELGKCEISGLHSQYVGTPMYKMEYNGLEEKFLQHNAPLGIAKELRELGAEEESKKLIVGNHLRNEHMKLDALNKLTHVLDDKTPMEYLLTKCLIEKVQLYNTYENKTLSKDMDRIPNDWMPFEEYLEKLKTLIDYLGKDYQIPKDIIQNKFSTDLNLTYSSAFSFDDKKSQAFLLRTNHELLKKVIEENKQVKTEEPLLLARIMDKKEFESFQTKGAVAGIYFEGERIWDKHNVGEEGNYTFMVFRNMDDALKNLTAVIPYLKSNYDLENRYLVFFSANNVTADMCYNGAYNGIDWGKTGDYGFEGYNQSFEVALPFYDINNFTILSCAEIGSNILEKVFVNELENLNVLNASTEDLNSEIYNDFMNSFDEESKEYFEKDCRGDDINEYSIKYYLKENPDRAGYSYDELKEMILSNNTRSEFLFRFETYYENKLMSKESFSLDDVCADALKFAKIVQEQYNISDEDVYKLAGEITQKIDYWYCTTPPEQDMEYDEDYDEEYDEDYDEEYDEEYDGDTQNNMEEDEENLESYAEYYEDECCL